MRGTRTGLAAWTGVLAAAATLWLGAVGAASAAQPTSAGGAGVGERLDFDDFCSGLSRCDLGGDTTLSPARGEELSEAKAQAKAAGLACQVSTARHAGDGRLTTRNGRIIRAKAWEVACKDSFGFMLVGPDGGSSDTVALPCPAHLSIMRPFHVVPWWGREYEKPFCLLQGNALDHVKLHAIMAKLGPACMVKDYQWRGVVRGSTDLFEIACEQSAPGYVLAVTRTTGASEVIDCMDPRVAYRCQMTTQARQKAWIAGLVDRSGRGCAVAAERFVAVSASNDADLFEVRCSSGDGLMVEADRSGGFRRAIDCKDASAIGGGCVLK